MIQQRADLLKDEKQKFLVLEQKVYNHYKDMVEYFEFVDELDLNQENYRCMNVSEYGMELDIELEKGSNVFCTLHIDLDETAINQCADKIPVKITLV